MIKVGDRLPEGSFRVKQDDGSVKQMTTHELFDRQKVVLIGVPDPFTSTCHNAHIPLEGLRRAAARTLLPSSVPW